MSIGGVVLSIPASQPKHPWFESCRPLVHRPVLTGKVGQARTCLQRLGWGNNTKKGVAQKASKVRASVLQCSVTLQLTSYIKHWSIIKIRAPINGVVISTSASQPSGHWIELRRRLIHRQALTEKVGRADLAAEARVILRRVWHRMRSKCELGPPRCFSALWPFNFLSYNPIPSLYALPLPPVGLPMEFFFRRRQSLVGDPHLAFACRRHLRRRSEMRPTAVSMKQVSAFSQPRSSAMGQISIG